MRAFIKMVFISIVALFVFIPSALADNSVTRVDGKTRYSTAVNAAKKGWTTANTVVLVGKTAYADALSSVPFAKQKDAPVLYTNKDNLSPETKSGLKSLKTKKVIIIGGQSNISNKVANQLKSMGISVSRIAGKTRYDTATLIAKQMKITNVAIVANGFAYADTVAISPYAAKMGYPILLTNSKGLQSVTASYLKNRGIKQTIVIGGESRVNKATFNKLPSPTRVGGATRYDTAANVVRKYNMSTNNTFISNGFAYADSVSGASLAAKQGKAFIFTNDKSLPTPTRKIIGEKRSHGLVQLGEQLLFLQMYSLN